MESYQVQIIKYCYLSYYQSQYDIFSMDQAQSQPFAQYLVDFTEFCICPIGLEIMDSPFTITQCGHTFEHINITEWLTKHSSCPICRLFPKNKLQFGSFNTSVLEAVRILRLLKKKPELVIPLYQPLTIFIKQPVKNTIQVIEVYLQDIVATILIKYSVKCSKMAEFRQGQRMLLYKGKLLKNNLLIQDYNIQPYSILLYSANLSRRQ